MAERKDGVLVIVSGFSGVGKGTVIKKLMENYPQDYAFSVSATTRAPRPGEVDGREYFFLHEEEFKEMIRKDQLVEYTCYQGRYYGTPVKSVFSHLQAGRNVILDIEVDGALQVKKKYLQALTIFLIPPTAQTLYQRLSDRGTETQEQVRGRLKRAAEEAAFVDQYECIFVNEDLSTCVEELHQVIGEPNRAKNYYHAHLEDARRVEQEIKEIIKEGE